MGNTRWMRDFVGQGSSRSKSLSGLFWISDGPKCKATLTVSTYTGIMTALLWSQGAVFGLIVYCQPLFYVFKLKREVALKRISPARMMSL